MAAQRRPDPRRHLDAALVPLEGALLYRAGELENREAPEHIGGKPAAEWLAAEFRALAGELHHH